MPKINTALAPHEPVRVLTTEAFQKAFHYLREVHPDDTPKTTALNAASLVCQEVTLEMVEGIADAGHDFRHAENLLAATFIASIIANNPCCPPHDMMRVAEIAGIAANMLAQRGPDDA